jgi:hypothetical protein
MKKTITTSSYQNKIAQQAMKEKRFYGDIQVEIFIPEVEINANPSDPTAYNAAYIAANAKMQQMAEEALKRVAWQIKYEQVDISLDHELSDPQTQTDIGTEPVEIVVQMAGHKIIDSQNVFEGRQL